MDTTNFYIALYNEDKEKFHFPIDKDKDQNSITNQNEYYSLESTLTDLVRIHCFYSLWK